MQGTTSQDLDAVEGGRSHQHPPAAPGNDSDPDHPKLGADLPSAAEQEAHPDPVPSQPPKSMSQAQDSREEGHQKVGKVGVQDPASGPGEHVPDPSKDSSARGGGGHGNPADLASSAFKPASKEVRCPQVCNVGLAPFCESRWSALQN